MTEVDCFQFGKFLLDPRAGGLFRVDDDGARVNIPIGARALEVLSVLVANAGELVLKHTIMDAVWSGAAVEESNLTVQISALRRALNNGEAEASLILTVPGRGYRFVPSVTRLVAAPVAAPKPQPILQATPIRPRQRTIQVFVVLMCIALLLVSTVWAAGWITTSQPPQRLSIVVLPFENLSGNHDEDHLADAITDDLTSELSQISGAVVIARQSAYTYKSKAADVRSIGKQLGVRYVLEGSVRKLGSTLRVNAQLVSGETGAHLWSDRFDETISDPAADQEQVVKRMRDGIGISLIDIENARSEHERPNNPDALDLTIRARAIQLLPASQQRSEQALALYERALQMDPSLVLAMARVAYFLIDTKMSYGVWNSYEDMERAGQLLMRAHTIAPTDPVVLNNSLWWLRTVDRCPEVVELAQHAIQVDPNRMRVMTGVYNELSVCKIWLGQAEEAGALQAQANRLNPRSPFMFERYRGMGRTSLFLGHDLDAIGYLQQSLALNPDHSGRAFTHRLLAAAFALAGRMEEARHALAEADRLWPFDTVRGHFPDYSPNPIYASQIRRFQTGLRLAGERDHADEEEDFQVPADGSLQRGFAGYTPVTVSGAKVLRTAELVSFLAANHPVILDTMTYSWGQSIPGAVGLKFVGLGGSVTDSAQGRLRQKLQALTAGDLDRPIVAVGWNVERFDGWNLALRVAAIGYKNVFWYRGGREAWEVNGLPETTLDVQSW